MTTLIESSCKPSAWCSIGANSTTSSTFSVSTVTEPVTSVARCARPSSWTATTATPSCTRTPPPDRLLATVIGADQSMGRRPRRHNTAHDQAG
ncbi:hypothetical protein PICSAR240_04439 [Mycobacterium avium subsp. paratuberculosis]|nr:hypothetical protein B0172_04583 [Mycobacterium avium subsp. paratuberculosis]QKU47159.1 hypothetical protein MAP44135_3851 [Mycobacterium avium subsp. paratuberculosis]CAG6933973.1 hypothetical protein PICSAR118_04389 [Mycobacterium avium subsp. paratuberculosis]CAG6934122.1 hypothetical protein PICSAR119_04371 [Mycobacterium avium subsp. paratuberculosis]CAG6934687.1 hypothetical protein PICSAR117_04419 [Mycobacterium avium subsp. paratuberculosis]